MKRNSTLPIGVALLVIVMFAVPAAVLGAPAIFEDIADPSLIGRGPGSDRFVGTASRSGTGLLAS